MQFGVKFYFYFILLYKFRLNKTRENIISFSIASHFKEDSMFTEDIFLNFHPFYGIKEQREKNTILSLLKSLLFLIVRTIEWIL